MILKKFGIVPDPSRDQHFLTNPNVLKKIVKISKAKRGDRILEIGAGIGTLTEHLVKTKAEIIAVEIDKKLMKVLGKLRFKNLKIRYENALETLDRVEFNKIVSNTPYSICEPLLNKLFGRDFKLAVLSLPEKFYRNISSGPGGYHSILGLKANVFFRITLKFRIPKEDFRPKPRTETVVVTVEPLSKMITKITPGSTS